MKFFVCRSSSRCGKLHSGNSLKAALQYGAFKKKRSSQSARFTRSAFQYCDNKLYLAKCTKPLNIPWWACPESRIEHDRDVNTITTKAAGLTVLASGENVSGMGRAAMIYSR